MRRRRNYRVAAGRSAAGGQKICATGGVRRCYETFAYGRIDIRFTMARIALDTRCFMPLQDVSARDGKFRVQHDAIRLQHGA
jgi:hypothetical protein